MNLQYYLLDIKPESEQYDRLDHIIHTKNIDLGIIKYLPAGGLEVGKQYPYNGFNLIKLKEEFQNLPRDDRKKYIIDSDYWIEKNFYAVKLRDFIKNLLHWSDHASLYFKPSIELQEFVPKEFNFKF